jgi:hypothetical protein
MMRICTCMVDLYSITLQQVSSGLCTVNILICTNFIDLYHTLHTTVYVFGNKIEPKKEKQNLV